MTRLRGSPHTYPLYALFILLAACAVVFSLLAPVVRGLLGDRATASALVVRMIIGLAASLLIGVIVGLTHHRKLRGVFLGLIIGAFLGPVLGALSMMPPSDAGWFFLVIVAASVAIVFVAAYIRLKSQAGALPDDHVPDDDAVGQSGRPHTLD